MPTVMVIEERHNNGREDRALNGDGGKDIESVQESSLKVPTDSDDTSQQDSILSASLSTPLPISDHTHHASLNSSSIGTDNAIRTNYKGASLSATNKEVSPTHSIIAYCVAA